MHHSKLAVGFLSLTLLALSACTLVPQTSEVREAIATAATASDHQKLADYFAQKATSYEAEAASHEQLANSYGGYRGPIVFISHCRSLQQGFAAAAKEARALEQAHRQLADSIGK